MPSDTPLEHFATDCVRDLAWVIHSPGLLNPAGVGQTLVIDDTWCRRQHQVLLPWLRALDADPQPLVDWLTPRYSPRLGHYFEALVEFWLRHAYPQNTLFPHIQVKEGRRTLGEFDYLLADSDAGVTYHWEVAVKFYLYYPNAGGGILWYGPNPRDRLDTKLQRLFEHQLRLSHHPGAAAVIRSHGVNFPVVPRLLLKGYLFYPAADDWRGMPVVDELSATHLRGWWTYLDRFEIPNAELDPRWLYLPRLRWLAPANVGGSETSLMNLEQLHAFCFAQITSGQRPPLIAEMRLTPSGDWREASRGFVVPNHWPAMRGKP